jgi:hypothetical protein
MGIDAMLISSIVQSIEKSIREMDAQPVRKSEALAKVRVA